MSRKNCACGCGKWLSGKQRKFFSDACRKRHSRTKDVLESPQHDNTVLWTCDISPFADSLKSANGEVRRLIIEDLTSSADYQDVWVKRILAQPGPKEGALTEKMQIHQIAGQLLRSLVDSLSAMEAA